MRTKDVKPKNPNVIPETLSVKQVADLLNMSPGAIYQAVHVGRLPARRWHGRILFFATELNAYLRSLPTQPVTQEATGQSLTK
jgi:excisionase family DNA binding protein